MASTKVADVYVDVRADLSSFNKTLATEGKQGATNLAREIGSALANPARYAGTSPTANLVASLIGRPGGFQTALRNAIGQGGFAGVGREIGTALSTSLIGGARTGFAGVQSAGQRTAGVIRSLFGSSLFKGLAIGAGIGAFLSLESVVGRLVGLIPDLVSKGRDYANEVDQISDVTGAATEESSKLAATLNFLGQDVTTVFIRLGQLSKGAQVHEAELNRLGVQTRDTSGAFLNQVQILDSVRSAFSKLADGTQKARFEVLLFGGRGGLGQLVDYLNLTDDQMAVLNDQFQKQGLIVSQSTRQLGEEALRAQKNIDNSVTGLATTLFATVGPQLVAFFDGLAKSISENAQKIADFVAGIVNTVIGLVQGLTGIDLNFNSITTQIENMSQGASDSSFTLVDLQGKLDAVDKKIKNLGKAGGSISDMTAGLRRQIKVIDDEIATIRALEATQDRAFRKALDGLSAQLDAETALLDAEDKRLGRAQRDQDLARNDEQAQRNYAKALRDRRDAEVDLASARAKLGIDRTDDQAAIAAAKNDKDRAEAQQDYVDHENANLEALAQAQQAYLDAVQGVADAQQSIGDAQTAHSDETRQRAEEDRRAQIKGVQDYITRVGEIADEENKKAAANTLEKRRLKLQEEQDAARLAGRTQEVGDLQLKIDAVTTAQAKVGADQRNAAKVTELENAKSGLQQQIDDFRGAATTVTEVNRAELLKQRADLKAKIAEEQAAIAQRKKDDADTTKRLHQYGEDIKTTYTDTINPAFESARVAGVKMANDIKAAIGGLIDTLLGAEAKPAGGIGPVGPRSGGLAGAIGGIVGWVQDVAKGLLDIASGLGGITDALPGDDTIKKGLILGAGLAAASGNFPLAIALLGAAGVAVAAGAVAQAQGAVAGNPAGAAAIAIGAGNDPAVTGGNTGPGPARTEAEVNAGNANRVITYLHSLSPEQLAGPYKFNNVTGGNETGMQALARLRSELISGKYTHTGYATGGVVGLHGPEYALFGEREPEYVIPASKVSQFFDQGPIVIESHVYVTLPWTNEATDHVSREIAYRRRR